jgi:hypothetical protein
MRSPAFPKGANNHEIKSEGEAFREKQSAVKHLAAGPRVRSGVCDSRLFPGGAGTGWRCHIQDELYPLPWRQWVRQHAARKEPKGSGAARSGDSKKETNIELATVIANGKGNMPSFKSSLSDDQIKGVIAYIHTLKKK